MYWDEPKRGVPALIILGTLLGIGYNVLHADPLPWIAEPKAAVKLEDLGKSEAADEQAAPEAADYLGIPESEFPITISLDEAKRIYESGKALILDAREHHEFVEGHIRGAESAPYDDVGGDPDWVDATAAKEQVILVYCGGGECELSINLGFAIASAGHRRVVVFEEGYDAWKEAGLPTRMGEKP